MCRRNPSARESGSLLDADLTAVVFLTTSNSIPDAYYLKGVALRNLKQNDRARESWDAVVKSYPDSAAASLAKQALTAK